MNEQDLQSNPFSALFPNLSVAKSFVDTQKSPERPGRSSESPSRKVDLSSDSAVRDVHELNKAIEDTFLVTLNKFSVFGGEQKQLVYLSSLAEIIGKAGVVYYVSFSIKHHSRKVVTIRTGWTFPPWSRRCLRG